MTVKLTICIPTIARDRFIVETLESIVGQLTPAVDIVIVDGNRDDKTEQAVAPLIAAGAPIRYVRAIGGDHPSNEGFDRDLDRCVEEAAGEYCWLFADDDVLVPHAIETVLDELEDGDPDLLVVDAEVRDVALDRLFERRRFSFSGRRDYGAQDGDRFMADVGDALTFVGTVVIRRSVWQARDRHRFYGSGFLHVGVIFQQPMLAGMRALGQSLVRIRMGNAAWSGRAFEIWMLRWPQLIWSFAGFSDAAKAAVVPRMPWRDWRQILIYRAYGSYGLGSYRRLLPPEAGWLDRMRLRGAAALPGSLAHLLMTAYFARSPSRDGSLAYNLATTARYAGAMNRWVGARIAGIYRPRTG